MNLAPAQLERNRRLLQRWHGTVTPCGISHVDVFNPCGPEEDQRGLWCVTCGQRQRLEILPPPPEYRTEVTELADGQFYWHVWYRGERFNGGLSASGQDAKDLARYAIFRDMCSFPGTATRSRFQRWDD